VQLSRERIPRKLGEEFASLSKLFGDWSSEYYWTIIMHRKLSVDRKSDLGILIVQ